MLEALPTVSQARSRGRKLVIEERAHGKRPDRGIPKMDAFEANTSLVRTQVRAEKTLGRYAPTSKSNQALVWD